MNSKQMKNINIGLDAQHGIVIARGWWLLERGLLASFRHRGAPGIPAYYRPKRFHKRRNEH